MECEWGPDRACFTPTWHVHTRSDMCCQTLTLPTVLHLTSITCVFGTDLRGLIVLLLCVLGFWQVRFLQMCTVYSSFHYRHVFVLTSFLVNVLLSSITRAFRRLSISRSFSIYSHLFNKTCAAWYWLAISHELMRGPTLTNTFLVIEWINGIYYIISG